MKPMGPIQIDPKTFLHEHCALPALPAVVSRIQEVILSEQADIKHIAELIATDPSLVAQVLKIVNSAYYSLPRVISDVKSAVAYLGLSEVYRTVLTIAVVKTLSVEESEELDRIWFHSFYTALCAKLMASKLEPLLNFEELGSAAILHDVGKLIYLKFYPNHYIAMSAFSRKNGCLFSEAEKHFDLPASAYMGELLCERWRLPEKVKLACKHHHLADLAVETEDQQSAAFIRIISLSNLMTTLAMDELIEDTKNHITEGIMGTLNCAESDFLALMGDVYDLKMRVEIYT